MKHFNTFMEALTEAKDLRRKGKEPYVTKRFGAWWVAEDRWNCVLITNRGDTESGSCSTD